MIMTIKEFAVETAIRNKISLVEVEKNYTLEDCRDAIKTAQKVMLQEKMLDESIVANHKLKNRRNLLNQLQANIDKLSINPYRKKSETSTSGLQALKEFLNKSDIELKPKKKG